MYAAIRANAGSPSCKISRSCGHTLEKYFDGVMPFGTDDTSRDAFTSASVDNCPGGCDPPPPADAPKNISSMLCTARGLDIGSNDRHLATGPRNQGGDWTCMREIKSGINALVGMLNHMHEHHAFLRERITVNKTNPSVKLLNTFFHFF